MMSPARADCAGRLRRRPPSDTSPDRTSHSAGGADSGNSAAPGVIVDRLGDVGELAASPRRRCARRAARAAAPGPSRSASGRRPRAARARARPPSTARSLTVAGSASIGQRREQPADQIGVVGEQRAQLLGGQRQRDRHVRRCASVSRIGEPGSASTNPSAAGGCRSSSARRVAAGRRSRGRRAGSGCVSGTDAFLQQDACPARGGPAARRWRCGTARRR